MKAKDFIKKNNRITYPEPREPYVKDGKTIGKIVNGKPIPLSKSDAIGPDGKIYFWMDPRSRGEEEKPFKFKPSEFKPGDKPSGSGKLYPDPLEPVFKDGKPVGVVMPDGKTRSWSKSDTLGPDGKVYFWMDPRGRKNKDSNTNEADLDQIRQDIRQRQADSNAAYQSDKEDRQARQAAQQKQDAEDAQQSKEEEEKNVQVVQDALSTGDFSQWNSLRPQDKFKALKATGLIKTFYSKFDEVGNSNYNSIEKLNAVLQQAVKRNQEQDYEIKLGPEGRAELQTKAEELAEMRRRQLRQERLEDEKIAYERYKDKAEREDAIAKIDKEYKHDLEVINTEHRNNMESIRTGNKHEIDKINLDHAEAERDRKQERDRDQADRDERKQERDREERNRERDRQQDTQAPQDEPKDDDDGKPFRPQAPAGPALSAPKPDKKPNKYDNSDAIDVDAKEVPDDDEKDSPGRPLSLPKPSKESTELFRILQLAGR